MLTRAIQSVYKPCSPETCPTAEWSEGRCACPLPNFGRVFDGDLHCPFHENCEHKTPIDTIRLALANGETKGLDLVLSNLEQEDWSILLHLTEVLKTNLLNALLERREFDKYALSGALLSATHHLEVPAVRTLLHAGAMNSSALEAVFHTRGNSAYDKDKLATCIQLLTGEIP